MKLKVLCYLLYYFIVFSAVAQERLERHISSGYTPFQTLVQTDSGWVNHSFTFKEWQAVTGQDLHSKEVFFTVNTDSLFLNITPDSQIINLGNTIYYDVDSNVIQGSFILKPFSSRLLFRSNLNTIKLPDNIIDDCVLYQNYPNPFNSITNIVYVLNKQTNIKLTIYDALGRKISVAVNEHQLPGRYIVPFSAIKLASGMYFYRIETDTFTKTQKMLLIK